MLFCSSMLRAEVVELLLQILTAAVFRYGSLGFFDGIGQVFYRHRLEYKIHHMILDGTLRVGKIRIAGQMMTLMPG